MSSKPKPNIRPFLPSFAKTVTLERNDVGNYKNVDEYCEGGEVPSSEAVEADWEEVENVFTQHCMSLSQKLDDNDFDENERSCCSGDDEGEDYANADDDIIQKRLFDERGEKNSDCEDDRKPSATVDKCNEEGKTPSYARKPTMAAATAHADEFDDLDWPPDKELCMSVNVAEAKRSVHSHTPQIPNETSNDGVAAFEATTSASGTAFAQPEPKTTKDTKNRNCHNIHIGDQSVVGGGRKNKKVKRSSTGGTLTLTQHFSSMKKEQRNDATTEYTDNLRQGTFERSTSGLVTIKIGLKHVSFKPGDVWYPRDQTLREMGFALTLGEIGTSRGVHVATIKFAWMPLRNAFLGLEHASIVTAATGIEWVRVVKHEPLAGRASTPDAACTFCSSRRPRT